MADDYDYDDRYADERRPRQRRYSSEREDERDNRRDRDRDDWRDRPRRGRAEEPKQSGWGILSFVTSLLVGVGMFLVIGVGVAIVAEHDGNPPPDDSPQTMALGCGILLCLALAFLGGVFGLVGVLQPDRKRIFALLGLVFNGLILLGVFGLFLIGLVAG